MVNKRFSSVLRVLRVYCCYKIGLKTPIVVVNIMTKHCRAILRACSLHNYQCLARAELTGCYSVLRYL